MISEQLRDLFMKDVAFNFRQLLISNILLVKTHAISKYGVITNGWLHTTEIIVFIALSSQFDASFQNRSFFSKI